MSLLFNTYSLARPALFSLDAETAHDITLRSLQKAYDCSLTRGLMASQPEYATSLMGLTLRNPVGLAAGLDKRSEERRVGKECVSTCRSRGWQVNSKKKQQ